MQHFDGFIFYSYFVESVFKLNLFLRFFLTLIFNTTSVFKPKRKTPFNVSHLVRVATFDTSSPQPPCYAPSSVKNWFWKHHDSSSSTFRARHFVGFILLPRGLDCQHAKLWQVLIPCFFFFFLESLQEEKSGFFSSSPLRKSKESVVGCVSWFFVVVNSRWRKTGGDYF